MPEAGLQSRHGRVERWVREGAPAPPPESAPEGGVAWCRGCAPRPPPDTSVASSAARQASRGSPRPRRPSPGSRVRAAPPGFLARRSDHAGSIRNPLACAYSRKAGLMRGWSVSARSTTALRLSTMRTRKTPPKKSQASSKPSITSAGLSPKVGQQNRWRLSYQDVAETFDQPGVGGALHGASQTADAWSKKRCPLARPDPPRSCPSRRLC